MCQIIDYQSIGATRWDSYVFRHARGTIFQTVAYLKCHSKEYKSECFGFAAVEGEVVVGVVAGVIYYNYFFPINSFTRRAIIEGGPIANNRHIEDKLVDAVTSFTKKKAIYTQYRNLWNMSGFLNFMEKLGYQYEEHLDIIHDLTIEEDFIIKGISKNKRGNVHKSINKGTIFREAEQTEWDRCVDLILGTYRRVGLPCQSRSYFINAFTSMSEYVKVFVAVFKDTIIGTRVELCYKELVYDWYAGADENYKNCYPNDILPYNILLWGKKNGYKAFDFGGAGKPDVPYGVREHKLKFGGKLVEFGRYERINNKLVFFLASKIVEWKGRIRIK